MHPALLCGQAAAAAADATEITEMGNDLRSQMKRAGSKRGSADRASDWNEPILPAGRPRTDRGGEAGGPLSERASSGAVPYPYFDETLFCQR